MRRAVLALALSLAVVAVALAAQGCGGGGGDKRAEKDYYTAIDAFCGRVTTAARAVSRDTAALRKGRPAGSRRVVAVVTVSLERFADDTRAALDRLSRAKVPAPFAAYQRETTAGFGRFIGTLRATARSARTSGTAALTRLGRRLDRIKLPDPPAAITANAKHCAAFTPR